MDNKLINFLKTCTPEERKRIVKNITEKYHYSIYNVDKFPDMFEDCYRIGYYEKGDITYAIFHPSQHYDDDMMLLRWDSKEMVWTSSFLDRFSSCEFPEGRPMYEGVEDSIERAALVILTHFRLLHRRSEFPPIKLAFLSPEELRKLAEDDKKTTDTVDAEGESQKRSR